MGVAGWEPLVGTFHFGSFWYVVGSFRLEVVGRFLEALGWEISLGSFWLEAFIWELLVCFGVLLAGAFVLELLAGNFNLRVVGWELPCGSFHVEVFGIFVGKLLVGGFRSGAYDCFGWELSFGSCWCVFGSFRLGAFG